MIVKMIKKKNTLKTEWRECKNKLKIPIKIKE